MLQLEKWEGNKQSHTALAVPAEPGWMPTGKHAPFPLPDSAQSDPGYGTLPGPVGPWGKSMRSSQESFPLS